MAGPIPPCKALAVTNRRLNCGAPLKMTSYSMLSKGTIAMSRQRRQRKKKSLFLNFLKA